ncbi:hypothetical protein OIU76_006187 [Salix suchowensis]|uniref:Uncharacterized protein n=1 Tax=Salix suchowensis TaxID=1278906 RepID=A0ABQ9A7Y6_9ROSI|nr:hypothetical protein OIU78_016072 [Salix suchowensis]KAJ6328186.1 hypothetical protein OIU77_009973 [Salix suchowensis]KAJ6344616.1 hypothetical protein OIU76_006187 [Salix suchowensis]
MSKSAFARSVDIFSFDVALSRGPFLKLEATISRMIYLRKLASMLEQKQQDGEQKVETKSWNLPVGFVTAHSPMRTAHVSHLGSEMVVALPIRHHLSCTFIPYSPRLSDELQQDHHVNNNNVDVDLHRHFNLLFHQLAHHSLIDLMG